ncbi:hypothetical protein UFOVP9_31 [uncultured Caudovirales phage]|jgi:glycerol-3-phosphate cytidylyltransferase-like family protein|uniref:Helix-turn-helix domain containing protein n=1 Tax=uncultured Caudovirales phage TaxID=2100421 RepID=A0A6J5KGV3_9CAUD|nr:hypothetical protein UFOVP9_31 [uncultured Caudovirales phage]
MNNNNSVRNNQAFSQLSINIVNALGGVLHETHIPQRLSQRRYNPLRMKAIRYILWYLNTFNGAFPSHDTIAKHVGWSRRQTVIDAFKVFEEDGLFEVTHLGHYRISNSYKLGSLFKCRQVIYALKDTLTNLYRAFCRTLQWAYDIVIKRNETLNFKTHRTLSTNVVVFGTNTNTTTFNNRKIMKKSSSFFVENADRMVHGFNNLNKFKKEEPIKQKTTEETIKYNGYQSVFARILGIK